MIDFHSHILPNVDDGSRSVEETFSMIKEAEKAGFDSIISTSHYMEGYYETQNEERSFWLEAIEKNFKTQNINMKLYLGNEIYITENIIKLLENNKASTINNTAYVLFEFPLTVEPMNIYDLIYDMTKNKIVPILAHPERYLFVQKDPELIYELIQKGVLMQSNYGSFIGRYGESAEIIARKLLENNMVHLLGSDAHRANTIYPQVPNVLKELKRLVGEEKVIEMTDTNPKLVLNNKRIDIAEPQHLKLSFKEKLVMNLKK